MGKTKDRIEEANRKTRQAIVLLAKEQPDRLMNEEFICNTVSVWRTTDFTTRSALTDKIVIDQVNQLVSEGKLDGMSPAGDEAVLYGLPPVVQHRLREPLMYFSRRLTSYEASTEVSPIGRSQYALAERIRDFIRNEGTVSLAGIEDFVNDGQPRVGIGAALESLEHLGYIIPADDGSNGRLEQYTYFDRTTAAPTAMREHWAVRMEEVYDKAIRENEEEKAVVHPPYVMEGTAEERDQDDADAMRMAAEKNARHDVRAAILAKLEESGPMRQADLHQNCWRATGAQRASGLTYTMIQDALSSLLNDNKVRAVTGADTFHHEGLLIEIAPEPEPTVQPKKEPKIKHRKEYVARLAGDGSALLSKWVWRCSCGRMGQSISEHLATSGLEAHIFESRHIVADREQMKDLPAEVVLRDASGAFYFSTEHVSRGGERRWVIPNVQGLALLNRVSYPAEIVYPRNGRDGMVD